MWRKSCQCWTCPRHVKSLHYIARPFACTHAIYPSKTFQTVNQRRHSSLVLTPRLCLCALEQQTGVSQTGWALNGKKPSLNMSHHVFFVLWNLKTCLPSLFYYSLCSFVNSATLVSLSHSFSPFLSLCFIISFSNFPYVLHLPVKRGRVPGVQFGVASWVFAHFLV